MRNSSAFRAVTVTIVQLLLLQCTKFVFVPSRRSKSDRDLKTEVFPDQSCAFFSSCVSFS